MCSSRQYGAKLCVCVRVFLFRLVSERAKFTGRTTRPGGHTMQNRYMICMYMVLTHARPAERRVARIRFAPGAEDTVARREDVHAAAPVAPYAALGLSVFSVGEGGGRGFEKKRKEKESHVQSGRVSDLSMAATVVALGARAGE